MKYAKALMPLLLVVGGVLIADVIKKKVPFVAQYTN